MASKHGSLIGSGGGKSSSGSSGVHEADDTLVSKSYARIKDVICEGPIEGFADPAHPLKCVFLDGTPIENPDAEDVFTDGITAINSATFKTAAGHFDASMVGRGITGDNLPDFTIIKQFISATEVILSTNAIASATATTWGLSGTLNFHNFDFYFLTGTSDQSYLPGFEAEEDTHPVSVQVKELSDWTQSLTDSTIDRVRVDLRLAPLFQDQSLKTANITGTTVRVQILIQSNGGDFVVKIDDVITGKASSPYVRTYVLDLAAIPAPWAIKVKRITPDSASEALKNDTYVDSYTEVTSGKLSHPNTVVAGVSIDAQQFSAIPTRSYLIKGLIIQVPANYDPIARTYATSGTGTTMGVWDGTFKMAWTNNPAWCWYAVATNTRWGLGALIEEADIDIFALYQIAQYCDQDVPDGRGGTEPRFSCNIYLQQREDAPKVLSDLASIFRGMVYFAEGTITAAQDAPTATSFMFSPANVIDGKFNYSGTAMRSRHNVALVKWNDLSDQGREKAEYVEDQDSIAEFGAINRLELTAFGCTSQGQAHRVGVWALITEKLLTDTVSFSTGLEGAVCRPGDIISLQDPFRAGAILSGRLTSATISVLQLDRPVVLLSGKTYFVSVVSPTDGTIVSRGVTTGAGTVSALNVSPAFGSAPAAESLFQLAYDDLVPELFRVLTVSGRDETTVDVVALQYNASIYDYVDEDHIIEDPPISILPDPGKVLPPGAISFKLIAVILPDRVRMDLHVSWIKSTDKLLKEYGMSYRYQYGNWVEFARVATTEVILEDVFAGLYEVSVIAFNAAGAASAPVLSNYTVDDGNPLSDFMVTGLELTGQGSDAVFQQRDAKFSWRLNSPSRAEEVDELTGGYTDPNFAFFSVEIYDASGTNLIWGPILTTVPSFIFTEEQNAEAVKPLPAIPSFVIKVRALDIFNHYSDPATLAVTNPAPASPTNFISTSAFQTAFLSWMSGSEVDLSSIQVWRNTINTALGALKIATVAAVQGQTQTFVNSGLTTGSTYYYFLRAVDSFGNVSAFTAGAVVTPGTVGATDIGTFAVDVTKMFLNTIVVWNDLWYDNSADQGGTTTAGAISWNAHTIYFRGVAYPISASNTFLKYVYWRGPKFASNGVTVLRAAATSYTKSTGNPIDTLSDWDNGSDFQIAVNTGGVHELAWFGFANAIIGSAYIKDAAITNAKIASLAVDDAKIANAGISKLAAGSVTADIIQVGLGLGILNPNPSFEQDIAGWTLLNGATVVANTLGGVDAADGLKHLFCLDVAASGAESTSMIPVQAGATYTLHANIRVGNTGIGVRLGLEQFTAAGAPCANTIRFLYNSTALALGIPATTWVLKEGQITVDSDCFFVKVLATQGATVVAGSKIRYDNVRLNNVVPNDQLTTIDGGKITTGQVQSNSYIPGVSGWAIDLAGNAEFKNITIRDAIILFSASVSKPTFTNDYGGAALTSRTYTDNDQLSIRPHNVTTGRRIRFNINGPVNSASQFWGWYPANHGGLSPYDAFGNTIPGREGVGPDDFLGIVQSDGAGGAPAYAKTTAFHVCSVTDPLGVGNWDVLGPEAVVILTWVNSVTTALPPPTFYRTPADVTANPTRGTASYVVRAQCVDLLATLHVSTNGTLYQDGDSIWYPYTSGDPITMAVGKNVYVYASRAGYSDSTKTPFANTTSSVPEQGGSGGTTAGTKVQP